jgi:hypothetical protein
VTAQTVSVVSLPWERRTRSSRHTCFTPGQSRYPVSRVVVRIGGSQPDRGLCRGSRPGRLRWPAASPPGGENAGPNAARMSASRVGWLSLTVRK